MPDDARLPAIPQPPRSLEDVGGSSLPPSLQILLDEGLYTRMKQLAGLMAKAEGFTPRHLMAKPEACFAIINTSLDWKLNPHFVARHTYQTPGGSIGFEGALVQSVLERSGRFVGAPEFEYHGDWEKLTGKFEKKTSSKGNDYVAGTWTDHDAMGLGIIVRWLVRGEAKARVWPGEKTPFWLTQCYPRTSPLWATDPKTQIAYLAIRRFANLASPGILGAASFDYDDLVMAGDLARDVTPPRPRPEDYATPSVSEPATEQQSETSNTFVVVDFVGEEHEYPTEMAALEALAGWIGEARSLRPLDGLIENNPSWAQYSSIIEAYKDQKEALSNPGNRQDRPATGAQQSDPARGATTDTTERGGRPAHAGGTTAPGGASAPPLQAPASEQPGAATEHPEGTTQPTTPGERSTAQEQPAARAATPAAAQQTEGHSKKERPRDEPKQVPHAPRDEAFWAQEKYVLPDCQKPSQFFYWLDKYLKQCRDQFDVNGIEVDNAKRIAEMGPNDQREAAERIAQRRKEIGG